jgi:anthranilate synthase component 1
MTHAPVVVRPVQVAPSTLLALHAQRPDRYPALLESAGTGGALGQYDILFAFPGARLTLHANGRLTDPHGNESTGRFLGALDQWWQQTARGAAVESLPFTGGWLVYLGYELAAQIEPRLRLIEPGQGPVAQAIRIPAAIILEHATGTAWLLAESESAVLLDQIERDLKSVARAPALSADTSLLAGDVAEDPAEHYVDAVDRALDYIAAGDIYQANLSRAWRASMAPTAAPHHVYQRLRQTNPGPFSGLAIIDDMAIVSSSPERLLSVRNGVIETRPIAGTRPRGRDAQSDGALARELHANPKERAEHVMLIDLERNDLGRVCEAGTVQVNEFMTIESYAHVHHIVSNIRGRLRGDVTPGQALAAVFPGGTITGCPKVRCMEIIAELERTTRGAYTGSLGYLNHDGSMDFNILIRSLQIQNGAITLRAGAGIVADSIPEHELEESRAKARGVLRALSRTQMATE